ncbi:MAG: hypothetical protein EPO13_06150 [Actinomycetota bacterium]|nr:MAG: hypothetical protein EPO13_06150 [Actinomycetota bacterium]
MTNNDELDDINKAADEARDTVAKQLGITDTDDDSDAVATSSAASEPHGDDAERRADIPQDQDEAQAYVESTIEDSTD